jgi:hypothetical protein
MLIAVGIGAAALLAIICIFAFSRNSSAPVRWAARTALIIIVLSTGVCLFMILSRPAARAGPLVNEKPAEEAVLAGGQDLTAVVIILLLFLALMIFVTVMDRRRRNAAALKIPPR